MSGYTYYFDERRKAEEFVRWLTSGIYHLRQGEACRPSYKIIKERNKNLWKIRRTVYYFGPKEFVSWVTAEEYNMYQERKK